ncbi:MAG: hypothetical protein WD266_00470 [Balneolales bacterium]
MTRRLSAIAANILPFLALLFLFPVTAYPQQVTGTTDRDSVGVGDQIRYHLTIPSSAGIDDIVYPDSADFGDDFDPVDRETISGIRGDSIIYSLRYFGGEDAGVPELPVGLVSGRDTVWVSVPPVPLNFISRISDESDSFRPFKPLYEFTISLLPYILLALLLAVLSGLAWRYYRNREVVAEQEPPEPLKIPPFKDPLVTLEQELEAIKRDFPYPEQYYKAYYSRIGDGLRQYFETLYAIPALESTTSELAAAQRDKRVHNSLQTYTRLILQQADMVKFARFKPDNGQCLNILKAANNFLIEARQIDGTRVRSLKLRHEAFVRKLTQEEGVMAENQQEV